MPREIKVAAIQMDGEVAPTGERLKRAETLIDNAVSQGAELIVLPATFNTGKTFRETNYEVTERLSDSTMQWLCQQAQKHQIHLAGSLMIVDKDDTYHAAFLVAPDGTNWRYDQQYPYLWERVFYRDGNGITVADTAIGKIGMVIGWDAAHPEIWERYAAKVDLMLVFNDTLDYEQALLRYKDGLMIEPHNLGVLANWLARTTTNYLHDDLETQSQWLTVPAVCAGASGELVSILPAPFFSIQGLLFGRASLWERADGQYADMELIAPFQRNSRILDNQGKTIERITDEGDAVIVGPVTLTDKTPLPLDVPQPEMSAPESARNIVDMISGALLTLNYRRGVRRQWGARMAPMDAGTRLWLRVLMLVAGLAAIVGWLLLPKKP